MPLSGRALGNRGTYGSAPLTPRPVRSHQWFLLPRGMRWSYQSGPSGSDGDRLGWLCRLGRFPSASKTWLRVCASRPANERAPSHAAVRSTARADVRVSFGRVRQSVTLDSARRSAAIRRALVRVASEGRMRSPEQSLEIGVPFAQRGRCPRLPRFDEHLTQAALVETRQPGHHDHARVAPAPQNVMPSDSMYPSTSRASATQNCSTLLSSLDRAKIRVPTSTAGSPECASPCAVSGKDSAIRSTSAQMVTPSA